ncbi:LOW QUALITY PROTEIN: peroxisome biogenesis factor 1 [Glossina fuscipes]|uniref:Peroxisomal ATPase PEX1 n=1 Tax=Glossina fuscipes TaxID=7396 RepID=A0A8U0W3Q4_9MUSC|nr:LOW QUALITY PROTEIN: peroxisome biogenesis factor 1 [Glossina fuscipes]
MFKRTFKVVFRPARNNFVLLPENYFKVVSTYDTGCLNLQYNARSHYISWAPHAGTVKETEIGINARVAKEIGLNEDDLVKCVLVADVSSLRNVFVTPVTAKDWEIFELSSEQVSKTILEQTRIINNNQILIVWVNKSIQAALTVDRLKPSVPYGRIDHTTELIVAQNSFKASENDNNNMENNESNKLLRSKTAAYINNNFHENDESQLLPRSMTVKNVNQLSRTLSVAKVNWQDKMERLKKDLQREKPKFMEFRVVSGLWHGKLQISDVLISESNRPDCMDSDAIYCMQTLENKEYYVRVKVTSTDEIPQTIHPTVEVNVSLMKHLNLKELEKVVFKPKPMIVNFVEKIELFASKKTHYKIVENAFKRFVIEKTKTSPMLLNQNEVVKLEEDLIVSVTILPEHFQYCMIDMQFLKENKIYAADIVRKVDDLIDVQANVESPLSVKDLIMLPKLDSIVSSLIYELKSNLCLDSKNSILRQTNILLSGATGTGKTVVVERVLDQLIRKPFYCYFDIFYCTRSKGRKAESIQKDLRTLFTTSLQNAPSILVLENLDALAHTSGEQITHDGEYYNRIADTVHQLIVQYTSSHPIAVIATINDVQTLNTRLYSPRGRHLFQTIVKLPNLELLDREVILKELCGHIRSNKLDFKRFAGLTEGYNYSDLVQFVERAIFYAYRINKIHPILTNEQLMNSLESTNAYCLHGIVSYNLAKNSLEGNEVSIEKTPALESVVSVLEEVLRWPSRYPSIFNLSPLRNQAGVLLYGPPGTGKTYLVSKISSCWNLRIISVKGPELLAKYIGQSEENVRNLFNRARSAKPCVLFFDEFDSLAPKRGHDSTGVTDRVVNQLLTELDGVEDLQGVTVIAATSRPELLDPALLRSGRIDRLVECSLPNDAARLAIFKALSQTLALDETVDFEYFASKTQNYTGADIQSILTSANMIAIKEALGECNKSSLDKVLVKQNHLIEAFNTTRPSLSAIDIGKYQKTYAKFTNKDKSSREYVSKRTTLA